jgi:hypothetical protein
MMVNQTTNNNDKKKDRRKKKEQRHGESEFISLTNVVNQI